METPTMCTATIDLVSPGGVPMTLHVNADDDPQTIIDTLDRVEKIGAFCAQRGWSFASPGLTHNNVTKAPNGPTFAGYPCSPTTDERGLPTWIIVEGKQAQRREKQGDVWYSVKQADGNYVQVLRIPKGEKMPETQGL
jgi:hypothetical protein